MSDIWIKHPGRCSFALDILEEPRAAYADRFVLSQINLGAVAADDFDIEENGAVFLKDIAKKEISVCVADTQTGDNYSSFSRQKNCSGELVPYSQACCLQDGCG